MESVRYLRYALLTGVFLVPFLPFLVSGTMFFPFITGKNFAFRILIEIITILYLILALADPAYRPKRSWMLWAIGAFVLSAGVATILSVDPVKSFWSNFERMEGYLGLLHLAAYVLVAGAVLSTEKLWMRFFQVSVAASVAMGLYVLFQIGGFLTINQGGVRVDGTFGNAIYLAAYMLFHLFFTALLLLRERKPWMQGLYILALMLQFAGLLFTATRGAMIGLIGGIVVAAILALIFERERKVVRKIALGAIAAPILLIGGFLLVKDMPFVTNSPILSRFSSISLSEGTVKARFLVWEMALQGVKEKPVFGWGQENFNYVFNTYYNPEMYAQEAWFDRAHNSFLDWLVAGGIVTSLLYIGLFLLAFWIFLTSRLSSGERAVLGGLVAAYGFHSLFVFDNLVSSVYFFTILAFAHFLSKKELPGSLLYTRPVQGVPLMLMGGAIALVAVWGIYVLNVPGIATAQNLLQAITPSNRAIINGSLQQIPKDPKQNLAEFKEALSGAPLGRQETVEQLLNLSSSLSRNTNVDPQVKQEFFDYTYEQGLKMLEERPGDARLELFFGVFLNQWRRYDEALAHLNRAHELSPTKPGILMEIGVNSYLNAGNYEDGAEVLKKAHELAPAYREARTLYAVSLYYVGKRAEADALLEQYEGSVIVDDSRLLKAYFDMKLFDRVVGIWEKRIEADPLNIQLRISLAASHLAAGNRTAAVEAIREAIKLDPRFKGQGEQYIAEIQAGKNP